MSPEGFRRRIAFIEDTADGYYLGKHKSEEDCRAMMQFCTECVEADFYELERPITQDPWIQDMAAYFDHLFTTNNEVYSYL